MGEAKELAVLGPCLEAIENACEPGQAYRGGMKWAAVENREVINDDPCRSRFSRRPRPTRFNERASGLLLCLGPPVGLSTGGHSRPLAAQESSATDALQRDAMRLVAMA